MVFDALWLLPPLTSIDLQLLLPACILGVSISDSATQSRVFCALHSNIPFRDSDSVTPYCPFLAEPEYRFVFSFYFWLSLSLSVLPSLASGISDLNHQPVSRPFSHLS